jgi:prepilin-type N-terminal cleavage/methylation domain-containing protein
METRKNEMRKQKGFSLIELLIVVAIILIIAAIAIPNLLRARIAANESSAASGIRTINTAEVSYYNTYATIGYSNLLADLGPGGPTVACPNPPTSTTSCLIDGVLASNGNPINAGKSGYNYTYNSAVGVGGLRTSYSAVTDPLTVNSTGVRSFCSIEDGVVRYQQVGPLGGACTAAIAPLSN